VTPKKARSPRWCAGSRLEPQGVARAGKTGILGRSLVPGGPGGAFVHCPHQLSSRIPLRRCSRNALNPLGHDLCFANAIGVQEQVHQVHCKRLCGRLQLHGRRLGSDRLRACLRGAIEGARQGIESWSELRIQFCWLPSGRQRLPCGQPHLETMLYQKKPCI
jgi:hypothetical protein